VTPAALPEGKEDVPLAAGDGVVALIAESADRVADASAWACAIGTRKADIKAAIPSLRRYLVGRIA